MRTVWAVLAVSTLAIGVNAAHATLLSVSDGALSIWSTNTNGSQANGGSPYQAGTASSPVVTNGNRAFVGTYTGAIDFSDPAGGTDTIQGFLKTATGSSESGASYHGGLGTKLSEANYAHVSLFDFTFTLLASVTAVITHDDGISIWNVGNTSDLDDFSAPTTATPSTVKLGPGTYNLWYAEANGLPADLIFDVPEPLSLSLLGAGLVGLGLVRRRPRRG